MATNLTDNEDMDKKEDDIPNMDEYPPELLIKHPLQHSWTLWYCELDRNKTWEESQREISTFDTAEDFWSLFNHIKSASELKHGCDYSLFKKGIRPMWEDKANKNGGRWLLNVDRKQRSADLDNFWLEILLAMIGEGFDEFSNEVCGAVVNIRHKMDRLALWTSDAGSSKSVLEIGRKLKERLRISQKMLILYQCHVDTMAKQGSNSKSTYSV